MLLWWLTLTDASTLKHHITIAGEAQVQEWISTETLTGSSPTGEAQEIPRMKNTGGHMPFQVCCGKLQKLPLVYDKNENSNLDYEWCSQLGQHSFILSDLLPVFFRICWKYVILCQEWIEIYLHVCVADKFSCDSFHILVLVLFLCFVFCNVLVFLFCFSVWLLLLVVAVIVALSWCFELDQGVVSGDLWVCECNTVSVNLLYCKLYKWRFKFFFSFWK